MTNIHQAKILTSLDLRSINFPLPESWTKAAGILKDKKKINALLYQKQIRQEWEKRLEKLERLTR